MKHRLRSIVINKTFITSKDAIVDFILDNKLQKYATRNGCEQTIMMSLSRFFEENGDDPIYEIMTIDELKRTYSPLGSLLIKEMELMNTTTMVIVEVI